MHSLDYGLRRSPNKQDTKQITDSELACVVSSVTTVACDIQGWTSKGSLVSKSCRPRRWPTRRTQESALLQEDSGRSDGTDSSSVGSQDITTGHVLRVAELGAGSRKRSPQDFMCCAAPEAILAYLVTVNPFSPKATLVAAAFRATVSDHGESAAVWRCQFCCVPENPFCAAPPTPQLNPQSPRSELVLEL